MSLHVTYTKLKFLQWFVLFCYKIKPKMPLYFGTKSRIFSHPHRISSLWRTTIPNITVIGKFWFTQSWTPTIRRIYLLLICTLNIIICQTALPVKKLSPSPAANILYAYNVRSLNPLAWYTCRNLPIVKTKQDKPQPFPCILPNAPSHGTSATP